MSHGLDHQGPLLGTDTYTFSWLLQKLDLHLFFWCLSTMGVLCLKFILLGDHEGGEAFLITYELLNIAGMFRFPLVSCTATSADNANLNPGVAVDDSPG